jgi:tetratricopeptide (TPR) repeat protein
MKPRWLLLVLLSVLSACGHAQTARPATPRSLGEVAPAELFEKGRLLANTGDHVAAEQFLVAALRRGYPEEACVRELVRVCVAGGRMDSALTHAEPYLERHPEDFRLRQVVASVYLALGDIAQARGELERVIEVEPAVPEAQFLMAVLLRDDFSDPESARLHFANYLALAPNGDHASEARFWLKRAERAPVRVKAVEATP